MTAPARLTPPARRVVIATVTHDPIDAAVLAERADDAAAGAVVTFSGVVRNHDGGRAVTEIEYVGHPTAADVVAEIAADIVQQFPIDAIAIEHRLGTLAIGDVALAAAVSAAHRGEAFAALSELVEEVKRRLPVWKRQLFTDGEHEWTGSA